MSYCISSTVHWTAYIYTETEIETEPDDDNWCPSARNLRNSQGLNDEEDDKNGAGYADDGARGDVGTSNVEALDRSKDGLCRSEDAVGHDQANSEDREHFQQAMDQATAFHGITKPADRRTELIARVALHLKRLSRLWVTL